MTRMLMLVVMFACVPAMVLADDPTMPYDGDYAIPGLNNVYEIQSADFNGDGYKDFLVSTSNDAAVVLANSNETYAVPTFLPSGGYVYSVAAGLLNDDLYLDVIVAGDDDLRVYFGGSVGQYALAGTYYPSTDLDAMVIFDYDDDGDLDVIGSGYDQVCIYPNDGEGALGTEVLIPCGGGGNGGIATADLNGDTHPDLVMAGYARDSLYVLLNNGSGGFVSPVHYYAGDYPHRLVLADVDHDSNLDVAIANRVGTYISVLTGNADGTFDSRAEYTAGLDCFDISAGDFDEDGWADLAVGSWDNSRLVIMRNNQNGTFTLDRWYENSSPSGVLAGQFDGDTHVDIAVSALGSYLRILHGDGTGAFPGPTTHFIESGATDFATGDLDGDDNIDVVFTNGPAHSIYVVHNNGDSTFGNLQVMTLLGSTPGQMVVADVDNANGADVVVADDTSDSLYVLRTNASGVFYAIQYLETIDNPSAPIVAQLDGDAYLDIAVACTGDHSVWVWKNQGDGTYGFSGTYFVDHEPVSVAPWDFDNDSDVDLAVAIRNYPGFIQILENSGTGIFSTGPQIAIPIYLSYLAPVDLEGDGDEDMIATIDGDSLYVILSNGDGTFEEPEVFRMSYYGYDPVIGDVDNDGDGDILLHHGGYQYFTLIGNNGDGNIGLPMTWYAGDDLAGAQFADMNGDTYPDIVALSNEYCYDSTMYIYWNQQQQIPMDVDDDGTKLLPGTFALGAYPNPFNPTQTVMFTLPRKAAVRLEVFNILGQKVRTLVNSSLPAGDHRVVWDGKNDGAQSMSTGVYFYRLMADGQYQTHKTMLLK
jgi:adhesin/invasin